MDARNLLFIMSDEHSPKMLGCYGHGQVRTPNLDRLAERGTRFSAAYTNSPICIPARAAFATGRYAHETRYWDNAMPYDGAVESWGHRLQREGIRVESIGKLHYRGAGLDTGFDREIIPMHVMDGIGQVWGSVRDPLPPGRASSSRMLGLIGPGESSYNRYDRNIADEAKAWIGNAASRDDGKPWVLYVGFVAPHFPLQVPEPFWRLYPLDDLPEPKLHPDNGHARHPWLQRMAEFHQVDGNLSTEERRKAMAAYFGLCSYVDSLIGEVLDALEESGLAGATRVVYTSDHGDNVGARGMWGKSNMYEEAAGIPLIVSGDGVAAGVVCDTPVSLLGAYRSILAATGLEPDERGAELKGASWFDVAAADYDPERVVFSEYHAAASPSGAFMLRRGKRKLIRYVGYESEFFDLESDPEETVNLAAKEAPTMAEYDRLLRRICDPEATDRMAKNDQNALVDRFGGPEKAFETGTPGATPAPGRT